MLIFIWRGLGFLVVVVAFGCSLIGNLISNATLGDGYYDHHKWPAGVSILIAAFICWFLGVYLDNQPGRVVIDKKTGKEFTLRKTHSLFWIPVWGWGAVLLVFAIILFGMELFA